MSGMRSSTDLLSDLFLSALATMLCVRGQNLAVCRELCSTSRSPAQDDQPLLSLLQPARFPQERPQALTTIYEFLNAFFFEFACRGKWSCLTFEAACGVGHSMLFPPLRLVYELHGAAHSLINYMETYLAAC